MGARPRRGSPALTGFVPRCTLVIVTYTDGTGPDELPEAQRRALESRLAVVRAELAELAADGIRFPHGPPPSFQSRSEELEAEADSIREQLGIPAALGRPPIRNSLPGFLVLAIAIAAILIAIGMFAFPR